MSLRLDGNGPVATVGLDQPARRNALTPQLLAELGETIQALSDRDDLRVVVLRGAKDAPFSSGYDLGALPDRTISRDEARGIHAPIRAAAEAIRQCRHPVVAAVRGFAFGAALELVASCDIRLASGEARFSIPATRWGFLYPYEGIRSLIEVLGVSHATGLLLLGEAVSASRAYEMGLVHRVVPPDRFEAEVEAIATAVTEGAPLAIQETKALLQRARWDARPSEEFINDIYERIASCIGSQDSRDRRRRNKDSEGRRRGGAATRD
jgi:enoyl-CoA hydratase/carnithine racemase